jgi:hypothetical protein
MNPEEKQKVLLSELEKVKKELDVKKTQQIPENPESGQKPIGSLDIII